MAGSSRDINLDIVGHDKTDRATRTAAHNMERLRQKVDETNDSNSSLAKTARKGIQGMGQQFIKGAAIIRSGGPYLAVAAIGAGIVALPTIAAAAGIGIVAGLGGGLAAIGIKAALANKKVQSAFSKTKEHVVKRLREMAKPFEPVLIRIAKRAQDTFDSFAPELERAFKKMAPAIDRFSVNFFKALEKLKPAIQPVTDQFVRLADQIGPKLPGIFKSITDAILDITDALRKNPEAVGRVITGLEKTIQITGKVVAWLIRMNQTIALVVSAFQFLSATAQAEFSRIAAKFYDMVADILEAGAKIPGPLGNQFKKVATEARRRANEAQAALKSLNTDRARSQVELLQARIRQLKGKKVVTETDRAEIARSQQKISELQAAIRSLTGKTVTVTYRLKIKDERQGGIPGSRQGGVTYASGNSWMPSAGRSRIGGPQPVNVTTGPTTVNTRVLLDGREIAAAATSTVNDMLSRQARRARRGRR